MSSGKRSHTRTSSGPGGRHRTTSSHHNRVASTKLVFNNMVFPEDGGSQENLLSPTSPGYYTPATSPLSPMLISYETSITGPPSPGTPNPPLSPRKFNYRRTGEDTSSRTELLVATENGGVNNRGKAKSRRPRSGLIAEMSESFESNKNESSSITPWSTNMEAELVSRRASLALLREKSTVTHRIKNYNPDQDILLRTERRTAAEEEEKKRSLERRSQLFLTDLNSGPDLHPTWPMSPNREQTPKVNMKHKKSTRIPVKPPKPSKFNLEKAFRLNYYRFSGSLLEYDSEDLPKIQSEPRLLSIFSKDSGVLKRTPSMSSLNPDTSNILIIPIPIKPRRVYPLDRSPDKVVRRRTGNSHSLRNFIRRSKALTIHEETTSFEAMSFEPLPGSFTPEPGSSRASRTSPGFSKSLVNLIALTPDSGRRTFAVDPGRRGSWKSKYDKPSSLINLLNFMKNK